MTKIKPFFIKTALLLVTTVYCLALYSSLSYKNRLPNILFIIVDTLRSDHLGCYGYSSVKTPNIDRLALEGTLFENVISVAPLTLPAHCSIFTGTYPQFHGVRDNGKYRLDATATTLAEVLQKQGYSTAAFVSTVVLNANYGLEQGFETYDDEMDKQEKKVIKFMDAERKADNVTAKAAEWLKENKNTPFFLWVHYYDPHAVYNPPSPYKEVYKDFPYDGEIAYVDEYIGRLLASLKETGQDKNTLLVFASDHGEGLGEHEESGHAVFIYDATLKVPLIFHWPGKIPSNKRVTRQTSLVDVMPTILDLLGIPAPKVVQGQSTRKLIKGKDRPAKQPAYSESLYASLRFNWSPLNSLRTPEWKYIRSSEEELYNLGGDPKELKNVAGDNPGILKKLSKLLDKILKKTTAPEKDSSMITIDDETREKLMSLGYIQGTVTADGEKPLPKKMIRILEKINLGDRQANNGMLDDAIKTFLEVIAEDPDNMEVYSHLAQSYKEKKEYKEAAKYFRKAASFRPEDPMVHDGLGSAYKNMGMIDEAQKEFEIAHELDPKDPSVINNIGWCYQQKRQFDDAFSYYKKALALDEKMAVTHANMAICYRMQGKIAQAEEKLKTALELEPELAFGYAELCATTATKGNVKDAIPHGQKAIEIDRDSFDGYNNLGVCYEMIEEYDKALENYFKAIGIQPWNTLVYNNIANTYLKKKDYINAQKYLEKSLELKPDDAEIRRVLSLVNERLKGH